MRENWAVSKAAVEGGDSAPPLYSLTTPPAVLHPALEPQRKKDVDMLEQVQGR